MGTLLNFWGSVTPKWHQPTKAGPPTYGMNPIAKNVSRAGGAHKLPKTPQFLLFWGSDPLNEKIQTWL